MVTIREVVVGRGTDSGSLSLTWTATDKNMSQLPISIYYVQKPEGPWLPVPAASNLPNTGSFVCAHAGRTALSVSHACRGD